MIKIGDSVLFAMIPCASMTFSLLDGWIFNDRWHIEYEENLYYDRLGPPKVEYWNKKLFEAAIYGEAMIHGFHCLNNGWEQIFSYDVTKWYIGRINAYV